MRTKIKRLFGILFSFALVLGFIPGTSMTVHAGDESPYASLKNTTTPVSFDEKDWYLIDYDASTVTLLSKECIGISTFPSDGIYSGSGLETIVNNYYTDNISTDGKTAVSGGGMFLLTKAQAEAVNTDVLKCGFPNGASAGYWWLSDQAGDITAWSVEIRVGSIVGNEYGGSFGVRPALKLDLSKVLFDSSTNTFSLKPPTVDVTGVELNKTSTTLTVGDTETLEATVAPNNATDKTVVWSSDKESVATVDSTGKVTAVSAGTATITVTATNGTDDTSDDKKATVTVTVKAEEAVLAGTTESDSSFPGTGLPGTGSSNTGLSNSSNITKTTSPNTGDTIDMGVWYLLLIASLGGLGIYSFSKKKEY